MLIRIKYSVGSGKHSKVDKSFVAYLEDYENQVHTKFTAFIIDGFCEFMTIMAYEKTGSHT